MEQHKGKNTFYAKTRNEWRAWLTKNHQKEPCVWLIIYHVNSGVNSVTYPESVDEALCFGWIDSTVNKRDEQSKYQYFAPRKLKSNWSRLNRQKVEKLLAEGRMTPAGQKRIDHAKECGTWEALEAVQNLVLPDDLQKLLLKNKKANKNFSGFPPSSKRIILEWIMNAKRLETRQKRIEETVRLAGENIRANHYRPE